MQGLRPNAKAVRCTRIISRWQRMCGRESVGQSSWRSGSKEWGPEASSNFPRLFTCCLPDSDGNKTIYSVNWIRGEALCEERLGEGGGAHRMAQRQVLEILLFLLMLVKAVCS